MIFFIEENLFKTFLTNFCPKLPVAPVINIVLLLNIFLILFFILYQRIITDPLTGYKLYEKKFFKNNLIKSKGFEADHEITAKLIKKNYKIIEIPINYKPRTKAEGKKINFFDGLNL